MEQSYNDEKSRKIAELWNEGNSAGVIARMIGSTRNAVLGKITRMRIKGLYDIKAIEHTTVNRAPRSPARIRKDPHGYIPPPIREVTVKPIAQPPPLAIEGRWVGILETGDKTCRFTEDGKAFCNAEGFPYCPEHRLRTRNAKQY